MKKHSVLVLIGFALASTAFGQVTTDGGYESSQFGAPPPGQDVWHLPARSLSTAKD